MEVNGVMSGGGYWHLLALLINFAGFAGVWAFLERIASSNSLDPSFTERWIAIGLVTSGVGPLCVAFVGERLDRRVAIAAASTVTVLCLLLLNGETTEFKICSSTFSTATRVLFFHQLYVGDRRRGGPITVKFPA